MSLSQHRLATRQPGIPLPRKARLQQGNYKHAQTVVFTERSTHSWCCEVYCMLFCAARYLSTKLTMLGFFSSFMTRISLIISSFFGCFCKLICLMATCRRQDIVNLLQNTQNLSEQSQGATNFVHNIS